MKKLHLIAFALLYAFLISEESFSQQWEKISPAGVSCSNSCFINKSQGWFFVHDTLTNTESVLMHTNNGGLSWDSICTIDPDTKIKGFVMVDSLNGYLRYYHYPGTEYFKKTADGGYTWEIGGTESPCADFFFINADTGFYDFAQHIYKTMDGGQNWYEIPFSFDPDTITPEIENYSLMDIYFVDNDHGWLCAVWGSTTTFVFYTEDAGENWQLIQHRGGYVNLRNFIDTLSGTYFLSTDFDRITFATNNNFYSSHAIVTNGDINAIHMQSDSSIWLGFIQKNYFLKTRDLGSTFDTLIPHGFEDQLFNVYDFMFFGNSGYAFGNYIFKYIDTLNTAIHPIQVVKNKLNVYPNPLDNAVNIGITVNESEKITIELYTIEGKCVLIKKENLCTGDNHIRLSVKHLEAGIYLLSLKGNSINSARKLVIER